jgi:hypothetical protein
MSIDPTSCASSAMPGALLLLWLCNIMLGAGLTLLGVQLCNQVRRSKQDTCRLEEEAARARVQRKQEQEAALLQREREPEAIDLLMDARMLCPGCWEVRHPGMCFPFSRQCLCRDHSDQHELAKATGAHLWRPEALISVVVYRCLTVEGICA